MTAAEYKKLMGEAWKVYAAASGKDFHETVNEVDKQTQELFERYGKGLVVDCVISGLINQLRDEQNDRDKAAKAEKELRAALHINEQMEIKFV